MKRLLMAACALAALSACAKPQTAEPATAPKPAAPAAASAAPISDTGPPALPTKAPAGVYQMDPAHSTVVFRVSHLGFSKYTGEFTKLDGTLKFDPADPTAMSVEATIDPKSLKIPAPPAGFREELLGKSWLDAGQFPAITFKSTKVETTGPNTAKVTGDFTLHGVTKPVVLDVTFNGGYAPFSMDPGGRIGFSAKTTLKRSDFGIAYGVPAPGTNMGVSDGVEVAIESEFGQKPPPKPAG